MSKEARKAVIITGGSSGIGAAVARLAASEGYNVAVNYNSNAAGASAVVDDCIASGVDAIAVKADVALDVQCRDLVQAAQERFGRVDALVNNAGTTKICPAGNLDGLEADDFHSVYQVNTVGAFQMIRAVVPIMKETGGKIVNVASITGLIGGGTSVAYSCSKAALLALNKSMARELGPEICVNAVCPGFVEGDWMLAAVGEDIYNMIKQHYETQSRTNKVMTPAAVAENIWYFAARSQNVTGEHLIMDGGANLPY